MSSGDGVRPQGADGVCISYKLSVLRRLLGALILFLKSVQSGEVIMEVIERFFC
jgi:hypothetical protein